MFHSLTCDQLYFLVRPRASFDGFIQGKGNLYKIFWISRDEELQKLSQSEAQALFEYLNGQVFGISMDDDDEEEYERQKAFNEAKAKELEARAAKKKGDGDEIGD